MRIMLYMRYIALSFTFLLFMGCGADLETTSPIRTDNAVSTSLCGDTYLQAFMPDHIAALSWQSDSPLSAATPQQKHLPQTTPSAENLLSWANHFILFGPGEGSQIQSHLPRTYQLTWTESFEGVRDNAIGLTNAMGVPNDTVKDWYAAVTRLKEHSVLTPKPHILYLTPAGGSAGRHTFVEAVMTLAGGQNVNTASGWHSPSIETLLSYIPDIIVTSFTNNSYHSRSHYASPVLNEHFKDVPIVEVDGKYWPCAGPNLLKAAEILQDAIRIWHETQTQTHLPKEQNDDA